MVAQATQKAAVRERSPPPMEQTASNLEIIEGENIADKPLSLAKNGQGNQNKTQQKVSSQGNLGSTKDDAESHTSDTEASQEGQNLPENSVDSENTQENQNQPPKSLQNVLSQESIESTKNNAENCTGDTKAFQEGQRLSKTTADSKKCSQDLECKGMISTSGLIDGQKLTEPLKEQEHLDTASTALPESEDKKSKIQSILAETSDGAQQYAEGTEPPTATLENGEKNSEHRRSSAETSEKGKCLQNLESENVVPTSNTNNRLNSEKPLQEQAGDISYIPLTETLGGTNESNNKLFKTEAEEQCPHKMQSENPIPNSISAVSPVPTKSLVEDEEVDNPPYYLLTELGEENSNSTENLPQAVNAKDFSKDVPASASTNPMPTEVANPLKKLPSTVDELVDVFLGDNKSQQSDGNTYNPPRIPGIQPETEEKQPPLADNEVAQTTESTAWQPAFLKKMLSKPVPEQSQYKAMDDDKEALSSATKETTTVKGLKGFFNTNKKKSQSLSPPRSRKAHLLEDLTGFHAPHQKEEQLLPGQGNRKDQFKLTLFERVQRGYFANEDESDCDVKGEKIQGEQYDVLDDGSTAAPASMGNLSSTQENLNSSSKHKKDGEVIDGYVSLEDVSNAPKASSATVSSGVVSFFKGCQSQRTLEESTTSLASLEEDLTNFAPMDSSKASAPSKGQDLMSSSLLEARPQPHLIDDSYVALGEQPVDESRPAETSFFSDISEKTKRFLGRSSSTPGLLKRNRSQSTLGAQSDITDDSYYFLADDLDSDMPESKSKTVQVFHSLRKALTLDLSRNEPDKAQKTKGAGCGHLDGTRFAAGQTGPTKPCGVAPSLGDWDPEPEMKKLQAKAGIWSLRAEMAGLENKKKKAEEELSAAVHERNEAHLQHENLTQKYSALLEEEIALKEKILSFNQ